MKFLQRFGRSLMLPVAVLPLAAILSGLGYWIINATGNDANLAGVFLQTAGGALLDNLPLLFAIGVSIGMATKPDGTRSEEHTSELQSRGHLVCRLLSENKT